jgi:hypothetical protein
LKARLAGLAQEDRRQLERLEVFAAGLVEQGP